MALTTAQIQAIVNEALAAGLDRDEVEALDWVLKDRAAGMDGATRLDIALQLADEREMQAAGIFLQESAQVRADAITRGVAELNAISDEEWERLING